MADDLFSKKPPIPPPLPGGRQAPPLPGGFPPNPGRSGPPPLPSFGAPPAPATFAPAGAALQSPRSDGDDYEKKVAELEKRLQEEREKVLRASLKNEQESATAAKVEASLQDLQERMRRERRTQEQEEVRLKLEAKIQEMEKRMAQERETWVATLKNQMQSKEFQEKEFEAHFASRLQEMERRNLEEKAQWQKVVLAKDEENRNLRSLCEKLKGADAELSRALAEKKWLESRLSDMREEQSKSQGTAQALAEKDKEAAVMRFELAAAKAQVDDLKQRLEREFSRARQEYENENRRVKAEALAEVSKYRETAEQYYAAVQKFKGVCAALERQTAMLKSHLAKKTAELQSLKTKLENVSRLAEHEREALRGLGQQRMTLQKALKSRQESLDAAQVLARDFERRLAGAEREKDELAVKTESLERVCSAQAAQIKNLEITLETLRGELAKESHVAAFRLKENQDLARKLEECRQSSDPPAS